MPEDTNHLSLKNLILEILNSKIIIISLFVIILSLGLIYAISSPKIYSAKIKIDTISSIDWFKYNGLTKYKSVYVSTASELRALLIEEIKDRDEVVEIIEKLEIFNKNSYEDVDKYQFDLRKNANSLKITKEKNINTIIDNEGFNQFDYYLEYKTDRLETIIKFYDYILNKSNLNVRDFLRSKFKASLNEYIDEKDNLIQKKEIEISNAIKDYATDTYVHLQFLREQSEIAKMLNISNDSLESSEVFDLTNDIQVSRRIQPYYLRGYIAIDKEIEIIQSRTEVEPYVVNLNILKKELRSQIQEKNDFVERYTIAYLASPVPSDEFSAATYDISNIQIEQISRSKLEIIFYSLILSIVVSFVIIFSKLIIREVRDIP